MANPDVPRSCLCCSLSDLAAPKVPLIINASSSFDYNVIFFSSSLVPASADNDGWAKGEGESKCYKML